MAGAWTRWLSLYSPTGRPEEEPEEFRKGKGKSGGAQGEGASDKRAVAVEARERPELPPAEGWKKYDTTNWEQQGCDLHLGLDHAGALAAKGLPDDGSNRSESFLDARRGARADRRAKPEGGEADQVDGQQTLAGIGRTETGVGPGCCRAR